MLGFLRDSHIGGHPESKNLGGYQPIFWVLAAGVPHSIVATARDRCAPLGI